MLPSTRQLSTRGAASLAWRGARHKMAAVSASAQRHMGAFSDLEMPSSLNNPRCSDLMTTVAAHVRWTTLA